MALTLEQRVAAIESGLLQLREAQPDAIAAAGGQKVGADGSVTYDFDGHVHAVGLDLDAGTGDTPPADRKARWLRENGTAAGEAYVYYPGGTSGEATGSGTAVVAANAENTDAPQNDEAEATLIARDVRPGKATAQLTANVTGVNAGGYVQIVPGDVAPRVAAILARDHGAWVSDFLQLAGAADRRIAFGPSSTVHSGTPASATRTVAHGLGVAPVVVLITSAPAPVLNVVYHVKSGDATNFTFDAFNTTGANATGTQNCYWLAIG